MITHEVNSKSDDFLEDFLDSRPSSLIKLLAAWDGLTTETQIKILHAKKVESRDWEWYGYEELNKRPKEIPVELIVKALESKNDYIRFLATNEIFFSDKDPEDVAILSKIQADKSALVRFSHSKNHHGYFDEFHRLSKEDQILIFSEMTLLGGIFVAKFLKWATVTKKVDLSDLLIFMAEFTSSVRKKFRFEKNDYDYLSEEGFCSIWDAIPNLTSNSIAMLLIEKLPCISVNRNNLSNDYLHSLEDKYLIHFLNRDDVEYDEFRKKIVLDNSGKYSRKLKTSAASPNLHLIDQDISKIICDNDLDVIDLLVDELDIEDMDESYTLRRKSVISPVYLHALYDYKDKEHGGCRFYGDYFDYYFEINTRNHDRGVDEKISFIKSELCKLGIYRLAVDAVQHCSNEEGKILKFNQHHVFGEELMFLKNAVIPNNAWETYLEFFKYFPEPEKYSEILLPMVGYEYSNLIPIPPQNIEELFGREGKYAKFQDEKINVLYNEVRLINQKLINISSNVFFMAFAVITSAITYWWCK